METKHTKGKWEYEGGDNSSIDIILPNDATISIDRNNRYTDSFAMSREEMEANAKLICVAPLLLQSLNEAKEALEWYMENTKPMDNDWQTFHDLGMNLRLKSEEIITKATES